ncbi:MAG: N-acetyl-gamma-glutamyl-phosphate reductase [Deltaproteobacteria bacterium]|nr:N-acetyl-gamma-glutamyl-phosphate reductase [Deltaproteobacteria bacterium]RLA88754.1 MAG: N-acetyl-gamma-glutamyl-phosphate reductase [Deltaproteobacteria bacterium]
MLKVAIVGATGYTGAELIRLLLSHSQVTISCVTSQKYKEKMISEVFPSLLKEIDLTLIPLDPEEVVKKADFIFTALPHKTAMEVVPVFFKMGKRVVDLSADFRFKDPELYEKFYQPHIAKDILKDAVYGLPEIYREMIRKAFIVGNPGCYPTSAILPLFPVLKENFIESKGIIIDAKSGVTGAGREVTLSSMFCEVNEGFKAYKVAEHRHAPEIEQELSLIAQKKLSITFVPHLVPMNRGILSTIYTYLKKDIDEKGLYELYNDYYKNEPFVRVMNKGVLPNTKFVVGSNFCDIGFKKEETTNRLILISAIDNLTKGASGQAVQNMNIMMGFLETKGLEQMPLFP